MTNIKVLGTGCATCKRLLADVNEMNTKNNWQAQVEYVTDIADIVSYGVMNTPALMVDNAIILSGHPGALKVEKLIQAQMESKSALEIDPAAAFEKSTQGVLFVDVREKSELETAAFSVSNILHIPLGELESRFAEIPTNQEVVMVCQGGGRSLNAVYFLNGKGYSNTVNMKRGIIGWMESGFPVIKGEVSADDSASCCDTVGECDSCCAPVGLISIDTL